MLLVTGLIGAASGLGLVRVNDAAGDLAGRWLPAVGHLTHVRVGMLSAREFESKHARTKDTSYFAEYEAFPPKPRKNTRP